MTRLIETKQDIEDLERRLRKIVTGIDSFAIDTVSKIIKSSLIPEIQNTMRQESYSERIIDAVILERVWIIGVQVRFRITNTLIVGSGFDIALAREETGISPHVIEGDPLAFGGSTIIGTPTTIFTTRVQHPGLIPSHIIRDTINVKLPELQEKYLKLEKEWMDSIL